MIKTIIAITVSLLAAASYADSDQNHDTTQNENPVTISTTTVSEETTDWGFDSKNDSSRVGMSSNSRLPGKTKVIKSTTKISQVFEIEPTVNELQCESDIDLVYYQKDTATEVRTLFTSGNCSEFDAKYQLRIAYFDAEGEMQRIVANEEWPVGQTSQFRKLYPMEPNSKLQRVSSRILSCTCSDNQ